MTDKKTEGLLKQAEKGIKEVFESQKYQDYLSAMSKFHNYSARNVLLIVSAKPEASLVAGFQTWKREFGRHVKSGEDGIPIIAYMPQKHTFEKAKKDKKGNPVLDGEGNEVTELVQRDIPQFAVKHVFDVSQTEGKPLPELTERLTDNVENYEALIEGMKAASPYKIVIGEIEGEAVGSCNYHQNKITVQKGMSRGNTLKTMIHEITHADLHAPEPKKGADKNSKKVDKRTKEVEAEAVAFVVSDHYGLDTSRYSFPYIAAWSKGKDLDELNSSLNRIQYHSSKLIQRIDEKLHEKQKSLPQIDTSVNAEKLSKKLTDEQMLNQEVLKASLDYKIPVGYIVSVDRKTGKQIAGESDLPKEHRGLSGKEFAKHYQTVYKQITSMNQVENQYKPGKPDGYCYLQGGSTFPMVHPESMNLNQAATYNFLMQVFMQRQEWPKINEYLKYNVPVSYDKMLLARDKYLEEGDLKAMEKLYPDKSETELRNLAGYTTITDETQDIVLGDYPGTWYTIDSTQRGGQHYYLMSNDELEGENGFAIVNRSGGIIADNIPPTFDGLEEHLHGLDLPYHEGSMQDELKIAEAVVDPSQYAAGSLFKKESAELSALLDDAKHLISDGEKVTPKKVKQYEDYELAVIRYVQQQVESIKSGKEINRGDVPQLRDYLTNKRLDFKEKKVIEHAEKFANPQAKAQKKKDKNLDRE